MKEPKRNRIWRRLTIPVAMRPRFTFPLAAAIWLVFTLLSVDWATAR